MGEQPLGAPKPERGRTSTAARWAGRSSKNKLFFFGNFQGTRFDAPGFETHLGRACDVAPRRFVEHDHGDPRSADRRAVSRQPDSGRPHQPDRRGFLTNTDLYPLPNRQAVTGVTGNYVGERLRDHRARIRPTSRIDWSASTKDKSSAGSRLPSSSHGTTSGAFPLLLGT